MPSFDFFCDPIFSPKMLIVRRLKEFVKLAPLMRKTGRELPAIWLNTTAAP